MSLNIIKAEPIKVSYLKNNKYRHILLSHGVYLSKFNKLKELNINLFLSARVLLYKVYAFYYHINFPKSKTIDIIICLEKLKVFQLAIS